MKTTSSPAPSPERARFITWRSMCVTLFFLYLAVLVILIFDITRPREPIIDNVNLHLGREIMRDLTHWNSRVYSSWARMNLIGNVLMFLPFGALVPWFTNGRALLVKTIGSGFLTIMAIETYQLISHTGIFDIDDIVLNTLGLILGYLLNRLITALAHRLGARRTVWR